jgi:tetratricopeptide (TPR) repeat protein
MSEDAARPQPHEEGSPFGERSKAKMAELFAMAMAYRDWSQRELAAFLSRDVHNMIPVSGVPKVDVVVRLAKALDWSVAMVLEDICGEREVAERVGDASDFRTLNRAAYAASLEGRHADAVGLSIKAGSAARIPQELAEADQRECVAWDGLGRYQNAIECAERGLARSGLTSKLRADLLANLASCHLALGKIPEAEGVAGSLLDEMDCLLLEPHDRISMEAHLRYVRGCCKMHRLELEPASASRLGHAAKQEFIESKALWERYAEIMGHPGFVGRATACRGGTLFIEAVLGQRGCEEALSLFLAELDLIVELPRVPKGDTLEGYGWWCVFASALALRADVEAEKRDRYLAIFVNKAFEIADLSGNWAIRERAFTVDYLRGMGTTARGDSLLDNDDVRILTGAMGRFPAFRPKGWELLRRAGRI